MSDRKQRLQELAQKNPDDPFPRYGLAMEHKREGDLPSAIQIFSDLVEEHPDYLPVYFHYGTSLGAEGRGEKAREVLKAGIDVALRQGNTHARSELEAALEELGSGE